VKEATIPPMTQLHDLAVGIDTQDEKKLEAASEIDYACGKARVIQITKTPLD
jgi:hypothetical protein